MEVERPSRLTSAHAPTYAAICSRDLLALSRALLSADVDAHVHSKLVDDLFVGWGSGRVPSEVPYPSRIGDDHSPFEYSVAFSPSGTELRLLFEAQASTPGDAGNLEAALAINRRLGDRAGVDLKRFNQVHDLFLDSSVRQGFSLWHAVCLDQQQAPTFKIYLNPQMRGPDKALAILGEAVARLGFSSETMRYVTEALRRPGLDELSYFSLDLSDHAMSRVKVYVAHPTITPAELDDVFGLCPAHRAGDVVDFCNSMAGPRRSFDRKPLMSCLSFVGGAQAPTAMTLHLPIAHYAQSDQQALERIVAFLRSNGLDHERYEAAVRAIARRPLSSGRGIQSYASYRREKGSLRLTTYLSPELFSPLALREERDGVGQP